MTFEDAVEARARSVALVAELVGNQIAWGRRLSGVPAISLQVIADPRPAHFKGFQSPRPTLVQIDIMSRSATEARMVREALIVALVTPATVGAVRFQRAEISNVRSGAADQQGADLRVRPEIFRESVDINFWHNG
ncbi:hypothetical protein ASE90_01740 [Sphingomonas sp. Leaf67]|uniref:hypothetical protein n=1 Tax=Sphingomonas sp. Leaf67 TaxID=1736230 RepID=UPI0006F5BAC7|nr:hypothetical protein [Sphingomonas sp. Leaf67]KQN91553.1 hypothetical protein ASE90_01740 [Sphingomonas sp. Leaf67]